MIGKFNQAMLSKSHDLRFDSRALIYLCIDKEHFKEYEDILSWDPLGSLRFKAQVHIRSLHIMSHSYGLW